MALPLTISVGLPPSQGLRPSQHPMEDKKKKRSPKPCLTQPAQPPGTLRRVPVPTSHSGSLALGLPHLPSPKQRAKFKRWVQKGRGQGGRDPNSGLSPVGRKVKGASAYRY